MTTADLQTPATGTETQETAQPPIQNAPRLDISDLAALKDIVGAAIERGLFKVGEIAGIVSVYHKLDNFLSHVKALAQETAAKAEAEAKSLEETVKTDVTDVVNAVETEFHKIEDSLTNKPEVQQSTPSNN